MLSRSAFETIASEAAAGVPRVVDYSISGYTVALTVRSASGKQRYNLIIEYDPVADRFGGVDPYPGGGAKIVFRRRFRELQ